MLFDVFIRALPKKKVSYLTGRLVRIRRPRWLAKKAAQVFANIYRINLDEAEFPLESYQCVGDLFTRRLKAGARPIAYTPLIHPVDAVLTENGSIEKGRLIQAKGTDYPLVDFLQDPDALEKFEGGFFATYYLCPTDYHRVHFPVSGKVEEVVHIPGALWPVNPWSVRNIKNLFAVNERIVVRMQTHWGRVDVVMVGATNVGHMSLSFDSSIRSNLPNQNEVLKKSYTDSTNSFEKGEELGIFHMGSTVILVFEKAFVEKMPSLLDVSQGPVRLGEMLAEPVHWQ